MTSTRLFDLPSCPPSLVSLCLETVLVKDLPVDDLPLTLQTDLHLHSGGHFLQKNFPEASPFNFKDIVKVTFTDVFLELRDGCGSWWCLPVGEYGIRSSRKKGWVEAGGVFRYVLYHDFGPGCFKEKQGWRIIFTKTWMSLAYETNYNWKNEYTFIHVEIELERI